MKTYTACDVLKCAQPGDLVVIKGGVWLGRIPEDGILRMGQHYQSSYIQPDTPILILEFMKLFRENRSARDQPDGGFIVVKIMIDGITGWLYPDEIDDSAVSMDPDWFSAF